MNISRKYILKKENWKVLKTENTIKYTRQVKNENAMNWLENDTINLKNKSKKKKKVSCAEENKKEIN